MKQDRFLLGILVGIIILAVAAVGLFLTRQGQQEYIAEDTPEGVVHNYVLALQSGEYERAYGYLAEKPNKPALSKFETTFVAELHGELGAGVNILESRIIEENDEQAAVVELVIVQYGGGGPFNDVYRNNGAARLVLQEGAWKIVEMPYPFWGWDWYVNSEAQVLPSPPKH